MTNQCNIYFPCSYSPGHIPLDMFNHPSKTTGVRILNFGLMNLPHFLGRHFLRRQPGYRAMSFKLKIRITSRITFKQI